MAYRVNGEWRSPMKRHWTTLFLAYVAEDERGFVKKAEADAVGEESTAARAFRLTEKLEATISTDAGREEAARLAASGAIDKAKAAEAWVTENGGKVKWSEYVSSITDAVANGITKMNYAAAASVFGFVERETARQAQFAAEAADRAESTRWLGDEGERIEVEAEIVSIKELETRFGPTTLVTLKTADGDAVKAFTAKGFGDVGDTVRLSGTVEHSEWRGAKETMLKRPRLLDNASRQAALELALS